MLLVEHTDDFRRSELGLHVDAPALRQRRQGAGHHRGMEQRRDDQAPLARDLRDRFSYLGDVGAHGALGEHGALGSASGGARVQLEDVCIGIEPWPRLRFGFVCEPRLE